MKLEKTLLAAAALSLAGAAFAGDPATSANPFEQAAASVKASQSASISATDQEQVRQAQQALNDKGFSAGGADGKLGPKTKKALKQFQKSQSLAQSGSLDEKTIVALGIQPGGMSSAPAPATPGAETPPSSTMPPSSGTTPPDDTNQKPASPTPTT